MIELLEKLSPHKKKRQWPTPEVKPNLTNQHKNSSGLKATLNVTYFQVFLLCFFSLVKDHFFGLDSWLDGQMM